MMQRWTGWLLLPAVACVLSSCVTTETVEKPKPEVQDPQRRAMGFQEDVPGVNPLLPHQHGDPNAQSYNVRTSEELEAIDNGAEGEVYFTDPDNPYKDIEGITAAFENRTGINGWMNDYGKARYYARRECRPLIIWFHDSVISPKSNQLGEHLLDSKEFNEWCKDRVVRVRFDSGATIDDKRRDSARYSRGYITKIATRYGLSKTPSLAVLSPMGDLMVGIDGYDGFLQQVEALLKDGVIRAEKEIDKKRVELEKNGYRTWSAARGDATLFAKLLRYNKKNDMAYLREYGGRLTRIRLRNLSDADEKYVLENADKLKKKSSKRKF